MPSKELTWDKLDAGPPAVKAAYWARFEISVSSPSASVVIAAENLIARRPGPGGRLAVGSSHRGKPARGFAGPRADVCG